MNEEEERLDRERYEMALQQRAEADAAEEAYREQFAEADAVLDKLRSNIELLYKTIGASPGTCTGPTCTEPVWWVLTKNGKRAPFTADGLNHFADCPDRERFRKGGRQ
jgi:hypothetical protein